MLHEQNKSKVPLYEAQEQGLATMMKAPTLRFR